MKALEGQLMEVFTPPPYREARPHGRPSKLTPEARVAVAQSVISKEMTYREAAKAYGISPGAVGTCIRNLKKQGSNSKRNEKVNAYNKASDEYRHQAHVKELKQEIADLYLQPKTLSSKLDQRYEDQWSQSSLGH